MQNAKCFVYSTKTSNLMDIIYLATYQKDKKDKITSGRQWEVNLYKYLHIAYGRLHGLI